jgi:hypothetical protein
MDGPVVTAARRALEERDVALVLPYVPPEAEDEVRSAFDSVVDVRIRGPRVREVADLHFFETVVRTHRAGEGAPYTGLRPAGADEGPVIPVAERAVGSGSPDELVRLLGDRMSREVRDRLARVKELGAKANGDVEANREYVAAMLDFQVWAHALHEAIGRPGHEHPHGHGH